MHLLAAQPGAVTDGEEAVDLGQSAGDMVYVSAADTELALLADARDALAAEGRQLPSLRLANLMQLGHNMSVDLYVESVIAEAKLVVVRDFRRCRLLALWHRTDCRDVPPHRRQAGAATG